MTRPKTEMFCFDLLSHARTEQRQLQTVLVLMSDRLPDLCRAPVSTHLSVHKPSRHCSSPHSCQLSAISMRTKHNGDERTRVCVARVAIGLDVPEPDASFFSTSSVHGQQKHLFSKGDQTEGCEERSSRRWKSSLTLQEPCEAFQGL